MALACLQLCAVCRAGQADALARPSQRRPGSTCLSLRSVPPMSAPRIRLHPPAEHAPAPMPPHAQPRAGRATPTPPLALRRPNGAAQHRHSPPHASAPALVSNPEADSVHAWVHTARAAALACRAQRHRRRGSAAYRAPRASSGPHGSSHRPSALPSSPSSAGPPRRVRPPKQLQPATIRTSTTHRAHQRRRRPPPPRPEARPINCAALHRRGSGDARHFCLRCASPRSTTAWAT